MGHIIMPSFAFRSALSEDAGSRSGFALTEAEMLAHLPKGHHLREGLEGDVAMRVGSDDYADTVGDLLHALGAVDQPGTPTLGIRLLQLLGRDWREFATLDEMMEIEAVGSHYLRLRNTNNADQAAVLAELKTMVAGKPGVWDALREAMTYHLAFSPYFTRSLTQPDPIALDALFASEKLPAEPECYFDQRFINYLANQPERLKDIHWRQFEGLTAEWFQRAGYSVELGPGRNDGSIDVRLWNADAAPGTPPAVIVQCKRQTRKVERVVVKALYADILEERADTGLVVTTSDISPGAASDVSARAYPITTANRTQVKAWIEAMRKPEAGVIAGAFD
ncbi:restriction endonuclease [Ensifer sp. ENS12]|uniref:restriction endonuclease n=1 Tax=Ensifer sp. ENS12 TaxID=2854774 RepID=UPI001C45CCCA|nr:restriction endonuclease [Ensifer sp. ENS12]MBV7518926.1 restriction endonuclease [Ensifer sp. ENS12]